MAQLQIELCRIRPRIFLTKVKLGKIFKKNLLKKSLWGLSRGILAVWHPC